MNTENDIIPEFPKQQFSSSATTVNEPYKYDTLEDQIVDELNQKHAIIHTSTTYILIEKSDTEFVLDSKASLLTLYENEQIFIEEEGKCKSKAQIWLRSPHRRTYHDITFNPRKVGHYEDKYNIWKGFAIASHQGNCSLYWGHVREVICNGNSNHYTYVRKWLAHLIQRPEVVATALVLRGKQGTGKGSFVHPIGKLFGTHYAPLSSLDQILGRFNAHLKNSVLIYADEAIWGGSKKEVGALKSLITEPKMFIEGKGKDGYWIDNFKHLIVSSNELWAVHLDPDDRRFFVLDVSDLHKEDKPYFKALENQLEKGGYESLMYDLLNEDLEGFDPRIMPDNFAGFDMKMEGTTSVDRFIYTSLKEGCWDHVNVGPSYELKNITIDQFYSYYQTWCKDEQQTVLSKEKMGRRLKEILPGLDVKRASREGTLPRPNIYVFPSLLACKASFEKFYKQDEHIWDLS